MRPDAGGGGANFRRGEKALKDFKTRIDAVLADLADSPASNSRVAEQEIDRSSFSAANAPFLEADGLFKEYSRVHAELKALSKTLSDQIEAMSIAVRGMDNGFDELEADVLRRFWAIQERTQQRADDARERAAGKGADRGHDKGASR